MPLLATFLGSVLLSVVQFFATWFGKQVAVRLALISVAVYLTAALWAAITALLATIMVAIPTAILVPASWIMPGNLRLCIASYATARVLIWAYHMDLWALKLKAV